MVSVNADPCPNLALHPDPTSVKLDELPAERQAEAGPLRLLVRLADLTKFLEHGVVVLGRDDTSMVPPSGVNFTALESKFRRTCFTLR